MPEKETAIQIKDMPEKETAIQIDELRSLARLGWLSPTKLDLLSRRMKALRLKKGEVLYRPGQPAHHVYCVFHGAVGLSLLGSEGRFVQLALLTRGEFFGETALGVGGRPLRQARVCQDSRVGPIAARTLAMEVGGLAWDG